MKKRILALMLALALAVGLMACSAPAADNSADPSADPSVEPSQTIEVDLTQDIITFATGLSADEAMLTVNGEEVPASTYLYWLIRNCSYYASYGLTPDLYGDMILAENTTITAYYSMLDNKCLDYGCPLTDDQQTAVQESIDEVLEDAIALYGLSEENLREIQSLTYYYQNVYDAAIPQPTEDNLLSYVYQAKHILIATATEGTDGTVTLATGEAATNEDGTPFTGTAEEYNAAVLAKAEDILAQIRAAEDPAATFDALMHEHSQDGRDAEGNLGAPDGYTTTLGQMVTEFEEAALALEIGGISDLVKSTFGYHIILRGEVEDPSAYAEDYREHQMNSLVNAWLAEADIVESEALTNLNVVEVYNRYIAYQEAKAAEMAEG